jgi:hypothetical protein
MIILIFTFNTYADDVIKSEFKAVHKTQNQALGILDACEKKYKIENSDGGFFKGMVSSDRDIFSGVRQNFALCEQENLKTNEVEINNLEEFTKNIEKEVAPLTILEDLNKSSLRQTLRALLFAQVEYTGKIDQRMLTEKISKNYPSIANNPAMLSIFREEVKKFKKMKGTNQKLLNKKIRTQMNLLGKDLRLLCGEIYKDYQSIKNTERVQKQGFHFSKTGTVTPIKVEDTKKTSPYHKESQRKITDIINKFKLNNHHSQLFSTPTIKEIFPLNSDMGKTCAKKNKVVFPHLTDSGVHKAQREYLNLLQEELQKRDNEISLVNKGRENKPCILSPQSYTKEHSTMCEKVKTAQKIEEKIKETLKYRPHLVGQLLEENKDSPWYQNIIAKYTCKYSNEIYVNDDEMWNAAELAIAGATIIGAIAAAPAIGLVSAGAGLYTLGAIAIGTEGYLALNRINDANKTEQGIHSGQITNQSNVSFQITEQERANLNKKWAVFDGVIMGTGLGVLGGHLTKVRKLTRITPSTKIGTIPLTEDELLSLHGEVYFKLKLIKEMQGTTDQMAYKIAEAMEKNNQLMLHYSQILKMKGVKTEIYESEKFSGFFNLRILSTSKDSPKPFRLYTAAAEKFSARELTFSVIDNVSRNSEGFFLPITKRVELGYGTIAKALKGEINATATHEFRHLMNLNRSQDATNNFFDGSFKSAEGKTLYNQRTQGVYEDFMSVDELYTFASDLWQNSKGGVKYLKTNIDEIFQGLTYLKQISDNSIHLSSDFLKTLEKTPDIKANFDGTYSIINNEGHTYSIRISNKKMKEIKKQQPEQKEVLIRAEMKKRLIELKDFATFQNADVRGIQDILNKRINDVKNGSQKQTDLEFSKDLQTELKSLGQNTRWLYKKDSFKPTPLRPD